MSAIKFKTNDKQAAEDLIREFTKPKLGERFGRLTEGTQAYNFMIRAIQVCPSNLLLSRLTGLGDSTISTFRNEIKTSKPAITILPGSRYGLLNAYQDYADKVLQIAEAMNLPLNHKHYHTVEEVKLQYAKRNGVKTIPAPVSTKSKAENLKNPYSDAEKSFFAQGGTKSEVIARFRAAGIGADKRTDMAIYQSFNKFVNKNKKTTVVAPVVEEKKVLKLITVPPAPKVNEDLFSKKVKLAKELGAKSIVIDNVTINF